MPPPPAPSLKVDVKTLRGLQNGDKDIQIKLLSKKGKAKTKIIKKTDEDGNVDFPGELHIIPLTPPPLKDVVKAEIYVKKKLLGTVTLSDFEDLVVGQPRMTWEGVPGKERVFLKVIVTADGFGKLPEMKKDVGGRKVVEPLEEAVDPNMPPQAELNVLYDRLMKELGLGDSAIGKASEMSNEHKWSMICQHKKVQATRDLGRIEGSPEFWVSKIKVEPSVALLRELQTVISTEQLTWVTKFIDGEGLGAILDLLGEVEQSLHAKSQMRQLRKEDEEVKMQGELIKCLRPLTNNKAGLEGVMKTHDGVKKIALCLNFAQIPGWIDNIEWAKTILRILTLICFMQPDGHKKVMEAMAHYKTKNNEPRRFESLVRNFKSALHLDMKISYITFINALVNVPTDTDMRVAIRNEFLRLGLKEIADEHKSKCTEADIEFTTQLDVFEEESAVDYRSIADRFALLDVDINDVDDIFNALKVQLSNVGLAPNFLGFMQNLVCIPVQTEAGARSFILACKMMRHIALNKEAIGRDPERGTISNLLSTIDENMDINPLVSSIDDDLQAIPNNRKLYEMGQELDQLRKMVKTLQIELKEKEEQLSMGSGGGGGGKGSGVGGGGPGPALSTLLDQNKKDGTETVGEGVEGEGPPPAPPPPGVPPPPPPPAGPSAVPKRKPRKEPKSKMKGFQWTKIPYLKLKGTLFEEFTETFKGELEYDKLEETFAAKVIEKKEKKKEEAKMVHILEHKVAQNLSIFLSQFKCTHNELLRAVIDLNESVLTSDQVKELQNFIPNSNDVQNIQDYLATGDPSRLGEAEKFSLALSRVPQIDKRLNAFRFKLNFYTAKTNIKPELETLRQACSELMNSKKMKRSMDIILEMGNFLNAGTNRSNAWAYSLNSLLKMPDTRSTDLTTNLAQYFVTHCQKYAPDLVDLHEDLEHAEGASKISLPTLTGDLNTLTNEFNVVSAEVENIQSTTKSDKFQKKMKKFIKDAQTDVDIMNKKFTEAVAQFRSVAVYFGEDPSRSTPEELFHHIFQFTQLIKGSIKDIEDAKMEEEKAERRKAAKEKRMQDMSTKKKRGGEAGQDGTIDELFQNIEDGQVYRKRRKGKKANDVFTTRQEARVREKPLPAIKKKPKTREELRIEALW